MTETLSRRAAYAVLLTVVVLILCTFRDYGFTWDEGLQNQYGHAVADYYMSGLRDMRYSAIANLYLYGGMFDGLAAFVDRVSPLPLYDTRHLLNALFGFLGLLGVWRLARLMGGDLAALIALVLCATTPMYYGHMFNNPKDIPFAACLVWTIYFMVGAYGSLTGSALVKVGIALGLTSGVRVGGMVILIYWLLPMGIVDLLPLTQRRDRQTAHRVFLAMLRKAGHVVLPVFVASYLTMLICWPWAQQNPVYNPLRALEEFSHFPLLTSILLNGAAYLSTQLPWYYVPVFLGYSYPYRSCFCFFAV